MGGHLKGGTRGRLPCARFTPIPGMHYAAALHLPEAMGLRTQVDTTHCTSMHCTLHCQQCLGYSELLQVSLIVHFKIVARRSHRQFHLGEIPSPVGRGGHSQQL